MPWIQPVTLSNDLVILEPLGDQHHDDLVDAVRTDDLYKLWYTSIPAPDGVRADIADKLVRQAAGTMVPFAVIDRTTVRAVGVTTYWEIDSVNGRVEIGYTWYRNSVQRTGINTAAKTLLLTHAFETLDAIAVELRTHFFNHRSRRAIERLGAKQDGILRNHRRGPDGTIRDTVCFSIIQSEWPTVKVHLAALAAKYATR